MTHDEKTLRRRIEAAFKDAHDFDPKDPLLGLNKTELSGPNLSRRATLRLLAASGTLTMANMMPAFAPKAHAQGAPGGTLVCGWGGTSEIQTLDPAQMGQVLQFQITSNVLSGLMHIDSTLVGQGDLAESWTVSEDGLDYVFKLREGVTFHNGDPFNADDVLFTFERSSNPEISIHYGNLSNVAALEKLNDYEVKFSLKKPQASFLSKTLERASGRAMTIVSRGALESMGATDYALAPVGTGPFKITSHVLGQGVTLEKFADYYDPERPKLDKIIIKPIDGIEPLAAALEAGDIQYIGGNPLAAQLIERFQANPDLAVDIKAGPGFQSVWMNPWRDPMKVTDFDKPMDELMAEPGFKVRLALAKALDREAYVKAAHFGFATPAYGTINQAMSYYYDEDISETSVQAFDPEGAQALLAEAGYPGGEGFPELELITSPNQKRNGLVLANIYKQVLGITVNVTPMEFSVGIEKFNTLEYDMRLGGSGGDYDPDDGVVDWMQTESKFNGTARDKTKYPFGFFSNAEADALISEQAVTVDLEKRKALVQEANKITSDRVACAFLYHPVDVLVHHKSVNVPPETRIPSLHDFDRITLS